MGRPINYHEGLLVSQYPLSLCHWANTGISEVNVFFDFLRRARKMWSTVQE